MHNAIDVFLLPATEYERAEAAVSTLLDAMDVPVPKTGYVLLKPNLISSRNSTLACTHPAIVRAVARYFLQKTCRVVVGDSPAYGSAHRVAASNGLLDALEGLDVQFVSFDRPQSMKCGPFTAGISQWALGAGLIVNLPKVKAHCQMGLSGGVKNLFGTVCGFRKALVHFKHGDQGDRFPSFFVHLMHALPRTITVMDGISAMHTTGPTHGQPYPLGLVGGCCNTVGLDTALYNVLGVKPEDVPIWGECLRQGLFGAELRDLQFPMSFPNDFNGQGFEVPHKLLPQVFGPGRLVRSLCKRVMGKGGFTF